ncbi:MAG: hypothetical protein KC912_17270 [Proteobacteria bacterium]|nr:hypothetical protein [Pseudomonadota bacterium]
MTRTLSLLIAFGAFASPALAQDEEAAVKYKERTEIDFESVDVTGELVKPEGSLLLSRKQANFNPLIRLREHWNDEMKQSIDEVK